MVELRDHPYFVGCQFHPEFKSRPLKAHVLFARFVRAAMDRHETKDNQVEPAAETEAASVAGVGAQLNITTANANATTTAFVDGDVNIDTDDGNSAGSVQILTTGVNTARAYTDGLNVGILGAIGTTQAFANATICW